MRRGTHAAGDGSFSRSAGAAAGRGIVLLAAAVVLGIILLNRVDTGPSDNHPVAVGNTTTTAAPATTTTLPARDPKDIKVLVANGTKVQGAGGRVKDRVGAGGYNVLPPVQATHDTSLTTTNVFFATDYQREALILAHLLGLADTSVKPLTDATVAPGTQGMNIVVEVGADLANQTGSTGSATTTTAAHTATTVAHSTTTTTAAKTTSTTVKH